MFITPTKSLNTHKYKLLYINLIENNTEQHNNYKTEIKLVKKKKIRFTKFSYELPTSIENRLIIQQQL